MKTLRYLAEALLLYLLFFIFKIMGVDAASAYGGWLGRTVGPHLAGSRTALANIRRALPGLEEPEYRRILAGMWDNLGRTFAEYPHLEKIGRERVTVVNAGTWGKDGPFMAIGAHLGNWETGLIAPYFLHGIKFDAVYRAPNNPWAAKLLNRLRTLNGTFETIPKSKTSTRRFIESMTQGRAVAMLIDQKYNEGIAAPFFGHDAMTSTAFVKIPQKFGCPLVPVRTERLNGAHFKVTFHPPLAIAGKPVEDVIGEAHRLLESWIREKPEQWLWLHRRWPSDRAYSS